MDIIYRCIYRGKGYYYTIYTNFYQRLPKKRFLCVSNYTEPYFDFHCLSNSSPSGGPAHGSSYYTLCGTPYENLVEYQLVIVSVCALGLVVYHQILSRSGRMGKVKKS